MAKKEVSGRKIVAEDSAAVGAITQPRFAALVAMAAPDLGWLVVTDNDTG